MSKAVLISIKPKWCELIASGKKTIEVRKTKPKLETPFKCYIYCTLPKSSGDIFLIGCEKPLQGNGKIIGEFICNDIKAFDVPYPAYSDKMDKTIIEKSCIRYYALHRYALHDCLYAWHISDLVIYDKPRELSEFYRLGKSLICDGRNCENCNHSKYMQVNSDEWDYDCDCQHQLENRITLRRPPQSWCYVEEV